ncbi:MAG: PIN domain-containing protein [Bacteroidetes bacterium]|nr:PIN domain-containing protein [Bacteroidota bacterium]
MDADVLFASAASPLSHSAGQVLLTLSEITLIDGLTSALAVEECRRNLDQKLPDARKTFDVLLQRTLSVVPAPSESEVYRMADRADWKDVPHLVTAVQQQCRFLVTYNTADYTPGHPAVTILRPGDFLRSVRDHLRRM